MQSKQNSHSSHKGGLGIKLKFKLLKIKIIIERENIKLEGSKSGNSDVNSAAVFLLSPFSVLITLL